MYAVYAGIQSSIYNPTSTIAYGLHITSLVCDINDVDN